MKNETWTPVVEPRRDRSKQCGRKEQHRTEYAAREHAQHLWDKQGETVKHYRCPYCDRWHVGHDGTARRPGEDR